MPKSPKQACCTKFLLSTRMQPAGRRRRGSGAGCLTWPQVQQQPHYLPQAKIQAWEGEGQAGTPTQSAGPPSQAGSTHRTGGKCKVRSCMYRAEAATSRSEARGLCELREASSLPSPSRFTRPDTRDPRCPSSPASALGTQTRGCPFLQEAPSIPGADPRCQRGSHLLSCPSRLRSTKVEATR